MSLLFTYGQGKGEFPPSQGSAWAKAVHGRTSQDAKIFLIQACITYIMRWVILSLYALV